MEQTFIEKLLVVQIIKKFLSFMGHEHYLPCPQGPATGPCTETDGSSSSPPPQQYEQKYKKYVVVIVI
jgi:hypothetical protein